MPLIDFQTNLKGLGFGRDMPYGGSSKEPFIRKEIPNQRPVKSGPDFILRNGFLAPVSAFTDVKRLAKFFGTMRGILFAVKQNVLSRTSVQTQTSWGAGTVGGLINQGVYTPLSTLMQAGTGWAGIHLNEKGLDPTGLIKKIALKEYSQVINPINEQKAWNRLTRLQLNSYNGRGLGVTNKEYWNGRKGFPVSDGASEGIYRIKYGVDLASQLLFKYSGGPGAILGIGNTKIFRYNDYFNAIRSTMGHGVIPKNLMDQYVLNWHATYFWKRGISGHDFPTDFRKNILKQRNLDKYEHGDATDDVVVTNDQVISKSPGYRTKNRHVRTNLGDPGSKNNITYGLTKNVYDYGYTASLMNALDKITAQPMYTGSAVDNTKAVNDLVQFRIAAIFNDETDTTGKNAVYMHFRAYLDDFSDNYTATWNPITYVGRAEQLYNYSAFERTMDIGFTVHATSKAELVPMYRKLNYLASTLAPDYGDNGFMKGNMHRITVGGYLYEVPGIIQNLSYNISMESGWEIAIDADGNKDSSVAELPHGIVVKMQFTPVHEFLVERNKNFQKPSARFISLQSGDGGLKDSLYAKFGSYKQYAAQQEFAEDDLNEEEIVDNNPVEPVTPEEEEWDDFNDWDDGEFEEEWEDIPPID
jgi:hypothetical protein